MGGIQKSGFTLIELLIALAVVGILASICDAANAGPPSVCGAAASDTGPPSIYSTQSPIDGGTPYYNLTIQVATATTYTLWATPINAQAGDGILELDSTGARRWDWDNSTSPPALIVGTEADEDCWEKIC